LHEVDKLTSKKYAKTSDLLCAGNKVFVQYQAQGGISPNTPLANALDCHCANDNLIFGPRSCFCF